MCGLSYSAESPPLDHLNERVLVSGISGRRSCFLTMAYRRVARPARQSKMIQLGALDVVLKLIQHGPQGVASSCGFMRCCKRSRANMPVSATVKSGSW